MRERACSAVALQALACLEQAFEGMLKLPTHMTALWLLVMNNEPSSLIRGILGWIGGTLVLNTRSSEDFTRHHASSCCHAVKGASC